MTTTAATAPAPPRQASRPGSVMWVIKNFIGVVLGCRAYLTGTIAFLLAAAIAIVVNFSVQYPGGVILAIPVLMMPIVQHNVRLMIQRAIMAVVATLVTYLITAAFPQQPWMLMCVTLFMIVVGLYLIVHGLDLLGWMICIAVPVLTLWASTSGAPVGRSLFENFNRLMIGLFSAEVIAILLLRSTSEVILRAKMADLFESLGQAMLLPPEERVKSNLPTWTTATSDEHEALLRKIRTLYGRRSVVACNLYRTSCGLRLLLGGTSVWKIQYVTPWKNPWIQTMGEWPEHVRHLTAVQLQEIADAIRDRRDARAVPGLDETMARTAELAEQSIRESADEIPLQDSASLAHQVMMIQIIIDILRETRHWTGLTPSHDSTWMPVPRADQGGQRSLLRIGLDLFKTPDRWALLFALKGGLVGAIGFIIASVYNWWGGVTVLLLMSLFLSALNMGAVTTGFVMRMVGLVGALLVTLVAMLVVIPIIDDPWSFTAMFVICVAPGAIAMQVPQMAAVGLSWAMSMMFTLTGMVRPLADLTPLQERFVSVTGATLLAWLVFLIVKPVFARDRINDAVSLCLRQLAKMSELVKRPPDQASTMVEAEARIKAYNALSETSSLFRDATFEQDEPLDFVKRNKPIMESLQDLFLIQRNLLRGHAAAYQAAADDQAMEALVAGASARAQAFEILADSLGTPNEQVRACIQRSSDAAESFEEELKRVLSNPPGTEVRLLPLISLQIALQLLQQYLESLAVALHQRQTILDQTSPVTVAGSMKV
ncbi:MAG: FUSC family protein [Phycisphaerales bacterium]|nr:FUSC family protein [Phycisphaerales bacterium]